jgi:hypothetical protein
MCEQVSAQDRLIERLPRLRCARMAVHIHQTRQNVSSPGNLPRARYRTVADLAVVGPQLDSLAARQGRSADVQFHAVTLKPAVGRQLPVLPPAERAVPQRRREQVRSELSHAGRCEMHVAVSWLGMASMTHRRQSAWRRCSIGANRGRQWSIDANPDGVKVASTPQWRPEDEAWVVRVANGAGALDRSRASHDLKVSVGYPDSQCGPGPGDSQTYALAGSARPVDGRAWLPADGASTGRSGPADCRTATCPRG